ncbi:TPA: MFS transporter [Thermoplasmata archaeon]|nr:MFS transporter [Thermoplasmata archaeon]
MKCQSCGADNPDYSFYCGTCAEELRRQDRPAETEPTRAIPEPDVEHGESTNTRVNVDLGRAEDALVAIAINVRRLFLVVLLSIFLLVFTSISSSMITLLVLNDEYSIHSVGTFMSVTMVIALIVVIAGIVYIISRKRLTSL